MSDLDIVIPVYNEERSIGRVLDSFKRDIKSSYRVLICYDYDEDTTLSALKKYPVEKLKIELVKNMFNGPNGAVRSGFIKSTAPAVLVYPADDYLNANKIDFMLDKIHSGFDMVCPSRFIPGGRLVGCRWSKAILTRFASFSLHHFAKIPVHDASNGFRMFSRRVIDRVEIESREGFTFSIELLVKVHRLGWKVTEIPSEWFERTTGKSRFRVTSWVIHYLRWYFYAFATTYLRRGPETVPLKNLSE